MPPQLLTESFGDPCERDSAGVGGKDRAGRPQRRNFSEQRALDLQILRNRLDDPIAMTNVPEIVFEIARLDQTGSRRREEGPWVLFHGSVQALPGSGVAVKLI